jgi:methylated-DNA-[protein]-cysteine S-methyltransferase
MSRCTAIIKTPIGNLELSESDGLITYCQFTKASTHSKIISSVLCVAQQQLEEYFSGQRTEFNLKLAPTGTSFQNNVWHTLQTIPYGETWSYQQLARKVGNYKASRAVGTANAKNPICIFIPCHRVILATGKPGYYAGGKDIKVNLLELEQKV